jgi:integrase
LAREILAKRKVRVAENRHLDVKKVPNTTFFELCNQYWEMHGQHKRMKGLNNLIEIWKARIGNVPLKELSQQRLEKYLNDRMEESRKEPPPDAKKKRRVLCAATRNRHLAILKAMFNKGTQWGLTDHNPAAGIERLRENGARTRFLDQGEVKTLLGACSDEFRPILLTAIHTGMRRGEILKLKWADVDFANRMFTVQESKSGKKRTIPMDETLAETLKALPSRFQKGYVFPSPVNEGKPMVDVNHVFRRLVDKAKIENVRFHDLRHTFASHLVMNGVDIKTVQELLGHANLTMTMRYSHLAPVHRARALKILDSALRTDTKTDTMGKSEEEAGAK